MCRNCENMSEGERVRLSVCIHSFLSPPRREILVHLTSLNSLSPLVLYNTEILQRRLVDKSAAVGQRLRNF
jgi:hypothetical protein